MDRSSGLLVDSVVDDSARHTVNEVHVDKCWRNKTTKCGGKSGEGKMDNDFNITTHSYQNRFAEHNPLKVDKV